MGWKSGGQRCVLALAFGLGAVSAAAAQDDAHPPPPFGSVHWEGVVPEWATADGAFRIRPRGRLLFDVSATGDSTYPARNVSGTELRSVLVGVEGVAGPVNYVFTGDFADHQLNLRSFYLAWRRKVAVGEVEVDLGNRLTERTIEGSGSSDANPFSERNVVASTISPLKGVYGMGVTAKALGPNWHLAAQVAGDDINHPEITHGTVTTTIRGHWNPVSGAAGTMHVGAWAFHEAFTRRVTSLARNTYWGSQHFDDNLQVSLGRISAPHHSDGYGVELGGVLGHGWSFVEYGERRIAARPEVVTVTAWAASAGWFLTGERPGFAARSATFVRMRPRHPVSEGGGGALELVGRYERLDNTDAPLGGLGKAVTVGVNWRLETWMRLMLNASRWEIHNRSGPFAGADDGESVTGRVQISF